MAKQKYRLETVLEIRDKVKKEAAQLVGVRRAQLVEAQAVLERCHQAVRDNLQTQREQQDLMFAEMTRGAEARRAINFRTFLMDLRETEKNLRENVAKQEKVVRQAETALEDALAALTEATKEVKVIEKHKETWLTNTKIAAERNEQKLNDEIGAILHSANKKK